MPASKRKSTSTATEPVAAKEEEEDSPLTDQEDSGAEDKPKKKRAKKQPAAKAKKEEGTAGEEGEDGDGEEDGKDKKKKAKAKKPPVEPLDPSLPTNLTVPDPLTPFERPAEGTVRISSWNVAGLRASEKKGFSRYVEAEDADILVVTETKTPEISVASLDSRYEHRFWGNHNMKGQAGTAIFSKIKPLNVIYGMHDGGDEVSREDSEGRCVTLEFENSYVIGTYVPNAGAGLKNMEQKKAWNRVFERYLRELTAKKPVIWCGDQNVVATEKDIRNWKTNYNKSAGCTDDEINGFNSQLNPSPESGHEKLVDVWRHLNPDKEGHYTYQAYKFQCRSKGIGWRLDYFVDALSRIIFASFPTCIDANQHTASSTQVDVLIGFATGDIVWMDPLTARYSRFNKSGIITNSPITSILWLPPAPPSSAAPASPSLSQTPSSPSNPMENRSNLFLTSHADGTMLIWDKDREDWNGFVPNSVPSNVPAAGKENEWSLEGGATMGAGKVQEGSDDMVVTRPAATDKKGQSTSKFNPVSHWKLSRKAITAFAFSPDLQLCAAVGEDGCLRIIDVVEEKLLDTFSSYFGALNCVSFSPDGRFVVTGGQDDLCTVFAPLEQHVVAHCQGHSSWVSSVAWDPWRSEDRTMRFVSVGDDCKLILWDLSSAALTRPKAHAHPHARRHSVSSQLSLPRRSLSETHSPLPPADVSSPSAADPAAFTERTTPSFHPAPRRDDVSLLQPVLVKTLSNDLFTGIKILPEYIVTSSRTGQVKQFDRPPVGEGLLGGLRNEFAASVVRIDARAR